MIISYNEEHDPFAVFMRAPLEENLEERQKRERRELEAARRSLIIESELEKAKLSMERWKKAVKILVLGQSMSGKSTTIKNFQITYAQKAWAEERHSWKAVIIFNLVHTANVIVKAVQDAIDRSELGKESSNNNGKRPTEAHKGVLLRLVPLQQIEKDLRAHLGAGTTEVEIFTRDTNSIKENGDNGTESTSNKKKEVVPEFTVRSSTGWKAILAQVRKSQSGKQSHCPEALYAAVSSHKEDIRWLWKDPVTRSILDSRKLKLAEKPGFFLDDINRITKDGYVPTDSDIVRARLRTTGVQEYHFTLDRANGTNLDWIMYDVAGIRTSRAAWIPYFREITAIIFLAPLSAFNEVLAEDSKVNCIEDTLNIWKTVCSSKLLTDVQIILFLNKVDLLRKKIQQGISIRRYIPEFDCGDSDFPEATIWFKRIFKRVYVELRKSETTFISHFTSAVDTRATGLTLAAVQATILRNEIKDAGLM